MVDEYFIAFVGGLGSRDEIAGNLLKAVQEFNAQNPTANLSIEF